MDEPAIVCTLTEGEMRRRRDGLLRQVRGRVVAMRRWPAGPVRCWPAGAAEEESGGADGSGGAAPERAAQLAGFELRLERTEEAFASLVELVSVESRCCAFLRFRLTVEPAGGALLLEVTGPAGGAELLAAELAPPERDGAG
jgi:hypothetical protein